MACADGALRRSSGWRCRTCRVACRRRVWQHRGQSPRRPAYANYCFSLAGALHPARSRVPEFPKARPAISWGHQIRRQCSPWRCPPSISRTRAMTAVDLLHEVGRRSSFCQTARRTADRRGLQWAEVENDSECGANQRKPMEPAHSLSSLSIW